MSADKGECYSRTCSLASEEVPTKCRLWNCTDRKDTDFNWFGFTYASVDTNVPLVYQAEDIDIEYPTGQGDEDHWVAKRVIPFNDMPDPSDPGVDLTDTQEAIIEECEVLKTLLLEKNRKYGDSAINPTRLFSKASPIEQINVRLDDKISRIKSSQSDEDEDVELDIMGYLILKRIAKKLGGN